MTTADRGSLWGGRFEGSMDPRMIPLNLSLDRDHRLWRHDIEGSIAWARALGRSGVLPDEDAEHLVRGLERVRERLASGGVPADAPDEDIHALVERLLGEEVGEGARRLHTGRSRNDQVATDLRLWARDEVSHLDGLIVRHEVALLGLAESGIEMIMPGYTHLQPGQPIRAAHWVLSHLWPLERDRARLRGVQRSIGTLPLGSGAVAGCPFPIDRAAIAAELGFESISENSLDAISDRDWVVELLSATALLGVHLSRFAEDLVLFSSREFGFIRLSDGFSTGSSLMPQKRNPDIAELTRGRTGRLIGSLNGALALLKGLPTGYNRDLQEDKYHLFEALDSLRIVLPAVTGAVETAQLRPDRMHDALAEELLATDLADYLVRRGVPFRDAHEAVGVLVRRTEEEGCTLEELGDDDFRSAHPRFEPDLRDVFNMTASVESRDVAGGTSRRAVLAQIEKARSILSGVVTPG
ncbi:MAG: argininosuccinate lyase [Longimicrobiales bacterium]|nr:argininosuccinate lyase [Longimicrobiales bacterium]